MGYEILRGVSNTDDLQMYFARCCHLPFAGSSAIAGLFTQVETRCNEDTNEYEQVAVCKLLRSDGRTFNQEYPLSALEDNIEKFNIPVLGYTTDMFNKATSPLYFVRPYSRSAAQRGFTERKYEIESDNPDVPLTYLKAFASLNDPNRFIPFEEGLKDLINGDISSFVVSPHVAVRDIGDGIEVVIDRKVVGKIDSQGNISGLRIPKEFLK